MSIENLVFWLASFVALTSAIMVLLSKNPISSVLWLVVVFFAISAHYVLLNAQFLAIVNLIVYAGAIMVLFLFVIMLMNQSGPKDLNKDFYTKALGMFSVGSLFIVFVSLLKQTSETHNSKVSLGNGEIGLIAKLGEELFTSYAVPFELCSVLFLSTIVGAVFISKK